ncbi:sulfite exporter TauE/SafE family protein [Candidatus Berkelbacteria bacterium]|nr:sulfite exporter TauE/SafE family protein [Candidatus Berkelbacteria bacterium]
MQNEPTLAVAFGAGLVSFFAPCVLILVPVFLANLAGVSVNDIQTGQSSNFRNKVLNSTLSFVLGFTLAFTALGALAGLFGRQIVAAQDMLNLIGGILIIIFGILVTGLIKIPFLQRTFRVNIKGNKQGFSYLQSFLVGLTFAIGWTPCVGPVLGAILILGTQAATVASSALLLFTYSIGLMLPFLVFALFLRSAFKWVQKIGPYTHAIEIIAGILLVLMGILVASGNLSALVGNLYFLKQPNI